MKLYLVQHADALPESVDPTRPLSEQGRQDAQKMAGLAVRLGLEVTQIRHSGKTRAEQTAAIFGQALKPAGGVTAMPGLGPKDDVQLVAKTLDREAQPIMLVGHLPFLERLAGLLLAGDPNRPVVQFCKAGIVCLAREEERWRVAWAITPEMARVC
jgi:phosphohistidine phosphatase